MKKIALAASVLAFPVLVSAQELGNIENLVESIGRIVNTMIPIVFALALLVFFWGLVRYIWGADHDKDQAKKTMLWGVVALFVMAMVWGLVRFIGEAVGVEEENAPAVDPLIPR